MRNRVVAAVGVEVDAAVVADWVAIDEAAGARGVHPMTHPHPRKEAILRGGALEDVGGRFRPTTELTREPDHLPASQAWTICR